MLIMLSKFRFFRSSFLGKVICICQVLRHTWFLRYRHSTWFFACIMCMCLSRAIYVCCNVCTCMRVCFSMFDEMAYINRDSSFCACKKWEEMWFNFIWRCGVCSKIEKAAPNRQFQRNTIWDFISMTLQLCFAFYYYRFFGTQRTIVTRNFWRKHPHTHAHRPTHCNFARVPFPNSPNDPKVKDT